MDEKNDKWYFWLPSDRYRSYGIMRPWVGGVVGWADRGDINVVLISLCALNALY